MPSALSALLRRDDRRHAQRTRVMTFEALEKLLNVCVQPWRSLSRRKIINQRFPHADNFFNLVTESLVEFDHV